MELNCRNYKLSFEKPVIQGIVNVTPDSFSDGGRYLDPIKALDHAQELVAQGAGIIDIGGESTRPGSERVSLEEELKRILPVAQQLAKRTKVPISIDTYKPEVAKQCLDLGAHIINDVSGLRNEQIVVITAHYKVPLVIMHIKGPFELMQYQERYHDVVEEVRSFLLSKTQTAYNYGAEQVILDPGFGFAKNPEQNFQLLAQLDSLVTLHCPVLIGPSRKSFMDKQKKVTTLDALVLGVKNGANILRVHDVVLAKKAIAEAFATV